MASVSGVSSSNTSSIYGNRNVFTGLATGMDTESMIENAVSGYQTKISSLQQRQTKLTWKQEAYRAITDPMVQFTRKYTSYTSSTNLLSAGYFNKAVTTTSNGANASKVTATGKTSSDIQVLGVKQLATAATYRVSGADLGSTRFGDAATITGTDALDLEALVDVSRVSGTLTLQYGGNTNKTFDLSFGADEIYEDAEAFADAINTKLADVSYVTSDGSIVKANTVVKAKVDGDGNISFTDVLGKGSNTVSIQSMTGKLAQNTTLGKNSDGSSISMKVNGDYSEEQNAGALLASKSLTVTVDGKSKTIKLNEDGYKEEDGKTAAENLVSDLNEKLGQSFSGVSASLVDGKLQITGAEGSTISVSSTSDVGKALGLGGSTATSYLNTSRTLKELGVLGDGSDALSSHKIQVSADQIVKQSNGTYKDKEGNLVDKDGYRVDASGNQLDFYDMTINGKTFSFTADTALESVLTAINSDSDVGLNVSFSKTTNSFTFTAEETGASGKIEIKEGDLAARLFGTTADAAGYTAGTDAKLAVSINGQSTELTRSDNSFDIDGLTLTLKGTFGENYQKNEEDGTVTAEENTEAVTFTTSADADKIIKDVTSMVEDLNKILKSVHDAYSTQPLKKSNNDRYEPLTEDDEADMTESAVEKYNEKAKTGLLFGDSDLSRLYSKLLDSFDTTTLSKLGITTNYSDGQTTLEVDEDALRTALENNPDSVKNAFTDPTSGLMTKMKSTMDMYANTSSGSPGILVSKAGSSYSSASLLDNTLQEQINELDDQIETWQDKLSDKIDYYTQQFSLLEQLTLQMNNQSSMLAGLMGG